MMADPRRIVIVHPADDTLATQLLRADPGLDVVEYAGPLSRVELGWVEVGVRIIKSPLPGIALAAFEDLLRTYPVERRHVPRGELNPVQGAMLALRWRA